MQQGSSLLERGIRLLSLSISTTSKNRLRIKDEYQKYKKLEEILEGKLLETYFQPIVELATGKNIGYEVFNRPHVNSIFPNTENFYDFIGSTNQYYRMDKVSHVLAVEQYMESIYHHIRKNKYTLFLNTFPNTLINYLEKEHSVLTELETYGFDPSKIVFEVSEKVPIDDLDRMNDVFEYYRSKGFRFALDDVGSGYNNLKSLVALKPEFIKLDKNLIQFVDHNMEKQKIVNILLEFANSSNLRIVAEGIERNEEILYLKDRGVHIGQGYAIGKPSKEVTIGKLPEIFN